MRWVVGVVVAVALALGVHVLSPSVATGSQQPAGLASGLPWGDLTTSKARATRPNIVLIQLDDFSKNLTKTMRSAATMRSAGADYTNAFVVDSLCCVSRAATFTGQYPYQSGVRTNVWNPGGPSDEQGGFAAFRGYGNEQRSFAPALRNAGYTTGYVGKYLNQFEIRSGVIPPAQSGWSEQNYLFGGAYDGWDFYSSSLAGGRLQVQHHAAPAATAPPAEKDAAYAGTVTANYAIDFLRRHRGDDQPYFLQVAPYAPHSRVGPSGAYPGDPLFPPAFADRPSAQKPTGNCGPVKCESLNTDDIVGYGDPQADNRPRRANGEPGPTWNPGPDGLPAAMAVRQLRDRARMAQSADRMVQQILDLVGDDAIVILTSDNGFHLGQNGLGSGKGSPYQADTAVPLLITGPGVVPGKRQEMVSNLDFAATFERLAGVKVPRYRAGRSFAASLAKPDRVKNSYVFFEHTWSRAAAAADPDRPVLNQRAPEMDHIPSYLAVRSSNQMLVRFDLKNGPGTDYVFEFYDYTKAGFEKRNQFAAPRYAEQVQVLRAKLRAFDQCRQYTRNQALPKSCRQLNR